MSAWAYVLVGWFVTAAAIAGYWLWIVARTRRAVRDVARIEDGA